MSIYASWRGISGDTCAHPARVGWARGNGNPCPGCEECRTGAPWVYQGSHVLPERDHPRGGSLGLASIPGHIGNDDPEAEHGEAVHPWLRLDIVAGDGIIVDLVLSAEQVADLAEQLGEWLALPKVDPSENTSGTA